jgi:hypothetical protein
LEWPESVVQLLFEQNRAQADPMGLADVDIIRAHDFLQFKMPGMPERTSRFQQANRNA